MEDFVEKVIVQGDKALSILTEYFEGKRAGTDMIKIADKAVSRGLKAHHIRQIQNNTDRSFSLRLIQYLPKDEKLRKKYIELTNPVMKGMLMEKNK